jgi:hypothetical protein
LFPRPEHKEKSVKLTITGVVALLLLLIGVPASAQFQNQKADLLQPRSDTKVVVPSAALTGFDFDWTDVPGATHYLLEVTRHLEGGGTQIGTVTATVSRSLYDSDIAPLVPGTDALPNHYTWKVTAFQGIVASLPSNIFAFDLVQGSTTVPPKPPPGLNPPPPPSGLAPVQGVQYTPAFVNSKGLFMTWNPVPGAVGYEVQLVREKDEVGTNTNNLHYRIDVVSPRAVVSNLTLFGTYRYEIRSIGTGNTRSTSESVQRFNLVSFLASDIFPDPPDQDGFVDEYDLFSMARNWQLPREQAQNPHADIVSQDHYIDQADLIAFLIQFHGAPLPFPQPRATPTPLPLDPPQLNLPSEGAALFLNSSGSSLSFSWSPVTNAQSYTLFLRNTTAEEAEFFQTADTEIFITGNQFKNLLGGSGSYTWEVYADAPGYIQSQSVQRTFNLTLTFVKIRKAETKPTSIWNRIGSFFFGGAAEAAPVRTKAVVQLDAPNLIFPWNKQCLDTMASFPLVWEEVPNATSYAVEITLHIGVSVVYLGADGQSPDAENVTVIVDSQPGDGFVFASAFSTFHSKDYFFRVQARDGVVRGPFSPYSRFEIAVTCPPESQTPYKDYDFAQNGDFDGPDFLAYSTYWQSNQGDSLYVPKADLFPATADGVVNVKDLLTYRGAFAIRDSLPRTPLLPPPLLDSPLDNTFFGPDTLGTLIPFSWSPQDHEFSDPVLWELEITQPGGIAKPFFSIEPQIDIRRFILEGTYSWRVRSYAGDGTPGEWSDSRSFLVALADYQPPFPTVYVPSEGAILSATSVQFVWSRNFRAGLYGIFDRIEIQNGDGPLIALDIYHHHSDQGKPTVANRIPLAPNFGPDFRWRVRTYYVIQDSFQRLFLIGRVEPPPWHAFTLNGDPHELSGLGAWNPDVNVDGRHNVSDLGYFSRAWAAGRNTAPSFAQEVDLDYDFEVGPFDLLNWERSVRNGTHLLTNGLPAPMPLSPVESPPGEPPVFAAINLQGGTMVQWKRVAGVAKYLVEWIDADDRVFAIYADELPAPSLVSPIADVLITAASPAGGLTLTWTVVPDAERYSVILINTSTGNGGGPSGSVFAHGVPAGPATDATISFVLSAPDLAAQYGGAGNYEWRVQPFANGHFADRTSTIETFSLAINKDASDYFNLVHPIVPKAKPAIVVDGSVVLPAFGCFGLHSWRVIGVADDWSMTAPSLWNRFGVQCLGPAFGGEYHCGQTQCQAD